jgi:mRNA-degrading endonuclease YafQ of YafQ-DinJ toxin-antitoxin module
MYKLIFTQSYEERVTKFLKKHPTQKGQYRKALELLALNPYHPSLRLHQFKTGSCSGYSISINLSYRISLEFLIQAKEIILINIGDHQEIYGKK